MKLEFFKIDFRKISKYQISQYVWWETSCAMRTGRRTDGRTDMTQLIVAFRNFANASKMWRSWSHEAASKTIT